LVWEDYVVLRPELSYFTLHRLSGSIILVKTTWNDEFLAACQIKTVSLGDHCARYRLLNSANIFSSTPSKILRTTYVNGRI
jgi:hypothetical protein